MDLYTPIFTRASTRKFDPSPLPADTLSQLEDFISQVKPLLPDVKLEHKIVSGNDVKGMALPKAPHFLLIPAENIRCAILRQAFFISTQSCGCMHTAMPHAGLAVSNQNRRIRTILSGWHSENPRNLP